MDESSLSRIRALHPSLHTPAHNVLSGEPKLHDRFQKLNQAERETHLYAFETYAGWTLPFAFPREHISGAEEVQYDYQSFGAMGVNNIVNKTMLAMFHPARPFFKGELTKEQKATINMPDKDIDMKLAAIERESLNVFAKVDGRTAVLELLTQLYITGNGMLNTSGHSYRVHSYRNYNAKFDVYGDLLECVLWEQKELSEFPPSIAHLIRDIYPHDDMQVDLYTGILRLAPDFYIVWQEVADRLILTNSFGIYTKDTLPYHPQRYAAVAGRQAGVGLIEMMAGDMHVVSALAETDIDLMAILTDVKTLVSPSAQTSAAEYNSKPPGAYVQGKEGDLTSHSHDVSSQTAYIEHKTDQVIRRLSQMFLLTNNVVRDAERVTAEEIRRLAIDLDSSNTGIYSRLAKSLQRPVAKDTMRRQSTVFGQIEPLIVTGLEVLSRMSELDNYRGFLNDSALINQVDQVTNGYLNVQFLMSKFASGWGINADEAVHSEEQKLAKQQKELEMQAAAAALGDRNAQ